MFNFIRSIKNTTFHWGAVAGAMAPMPPTAAPQRGKDERASNTHCSHVNVQDTPQAKNHTSYSVSCEES